MLPARVSSATAPPHVTDAQGRVADVGGVLSLRFFGLLDDRSRAVVVWALEAGPRTPALCEFGFSKALFDTPSTAVLRRFKHD